MQLFILKTVLGVSTLFSSLGIFGLDKNSRSDLGDFMLTGYSGISLTLKSWEQRCVQH